MDAAVFGSRNGLHLELRRTTGPQRDSGEALPRWQVTLVGRSLHAVLECSEAAWEPVGLADFLTQLATDWRGWDGDRAWQSEEAELRLTARHDKTNTVLVRVDLEVGAPFVWRCEAELELDPGAFQRLAEDVRSLSRS